MNKKSTSSQLQKIFTSVFSLLSFMAIDYFSLGHLLFAIPTYSSTQLAAYSSTVFLLTVFFSQILIASFSSITTGIVASIVYEAKTTTEKIAATCYSELTSSGEPIHVPSLILNIHICVAISVLIFALFSFLVWFFKLGDLFKSMPTQPIFGAMIAIGIEILQISVTEYIGRGRPHDTYCLLFTSVVGFGIFLISYFLISSAFFLPAVSVILVAALNLFFRFYLKMSTEDMKRANHIIDVGSGSEFSIFNFLSLFKTGEFSAQCVLANLSNIIGLAVNNSIHLNVNIPPYAYATGQLIDFDREWFAQFVSNIVTAFTGYPSYFVGSSSIMFYRSGATTRISSVLGALVPVFLAFVGPACRNYVPSLFSYTILSYVGFCFCFEHIVTSLKVASAMDISLILMTTLLCRTLGMVAGFFFGVAASVVITLRYFTLVVEKGGSEEGKLSRNILGRSREHEKSAGKAGDVVSIDYVLCFTTVSQVKKLIRATGGDSVTLDLTECPYVDMSGNLMLLDVAETGKTLFIFGRPLNLSVSALKANGNVHLIEKTY